MGEGWRVVKTAREAIRTRRDPGGPVATRTTAYAMTATLTPVAKPGRSNEASFRKLRGAGFQAR